MTKVCPDCIEPLIPQKRKLGRWSKNWLVCNNCGYREYENSPYNDKLDKLNTKQALENMNCKSRYYE